MREFWNVIVFNLPHDIFTKQFMFSSIKFSMYIRKKNDVLYYTNIGWYIIYMMPRRAGLQLNESLGHVSVHSFKIRNRVNSFVFFFFVWNVAYNEYCSKRYAVTICVRLRARQIELFMWELCEYARSETLAIQRIKNK